MVFRNYVTLAFKYMTLEIVIIVYPSNVWLYLYIRVNPISLLMKISSLTIFLQRFFLFESRNFYLLVNLFPLIYFYLKHSDTH